jgi:hypothetical protein
VSAEPVRLHPDDVEAIARRVTELVNAPPARRLVDAAELAAALGVSRDTVYANADRLGARRMGAGRRPRLRFDVDVALSAWTARGDGRESAAIERAATTGGSAPRRTSRSGAALAGVPARALQPRPLSTGGPRGAVTPGGPAHRRQVP